MKVDGSYIDRRGTPQAQFLLPLLRVRSGEVLFPDAELVVTATDYAFWQKVSTPLIWSGCMSDQQSVDLIRWDGRQPA